MSNNALNLLNTRLSFVLTLICIIGSLALAFIKNVDITVMLPTILATYVIGRTTTAISHGWAASKDPKADTEKIIEKLDQKD